MYLHCLGQHEPRNWCVFSLKRCVLLYQITRNTLLLLLCCGWNFVFQYTAQVIIAQCKQHHSLAACCNAKFSTTFSLSPELNWNDGTCPLIHPNCFRSRSRYLFYRNMTAMTSLWRIVSHCVQFSKWTSGPHVIYAIVFATWRQCARLCDTYGSLGLTSLHPTASASLCDGSAVLQQLRADYPSYSPGGTTVYRHVTHFLA